MTDQHHKNRVHRRKWSSYKHRYLVGIFLRIANIIIAFANYHTKAKQNAS